VSESISRRPYLVAGAAAAGLDLVTKSWVFAEVPLRQHRVVVPDFFEIAPYFNDGGPWSWGADLPPAVRPYFWPVLGVLAMAVIGWSLWTTPPAERLRSHGFALILGGAVGNLVDRVMAVFDPAHGGVRDFLFFPTIVGGRPFPAFNLADTWITVGVVLVGWTIVEEWRRGPAAAPAVPPAGADPGGAAALPAPGEAGR
jgi:signal peptidase II